MDVSEHESVTMTYVYVCVVKQLKESNTNTHPGLLWRWAQMIVSVCMYVRLIHSHSLTHSLTHSPHLNHIG